MTCIDLGNFTTTAILPLDAAPATWVCPGPQTLAVVFASADACLRLSADATPADFLLLEGNYARVRLDAGDRLSVVAATAAAGEVRVTLAGEA